jgi:hypothetical protein
VRVQAVLMFISVFRAGGMMLLSLILGALSLGYVGFYYPVWLDWMLTMSSHLKDAITDSSFTGIASGYNIWLKFLISEQTFVLMFFVLLARLVIVVVTTTIQHYLLGSPGHNANRTFRGF